MSLKIFPLNFRTQQSDIREMEVTEDATLSGVRRKTILVFLLLLNIFGDFRRDT
jgi:hypothetical protein